jgi:beta-N-acetylhexosaminidase
VIDPGELILSGLPAGVPDRDTRRLVAIAGFAGHLLLRRNVATPEALARLVLRLDPHDGPPPIIAIDEEGGRVSRLDHVGFEAPSAMALAAAGQASLTTEAARLSGRFLRAIGINVVLGPCLDVLSEPWNPVIACRAFGETAGEVVEHGLAAMAGYRSVGLGTVAKHFPGHGATRQDSHVARPVIEAALDTLRRRDLVPFAAALRDGAAAVMSAHVRYPHATPAPDADVPATLSSFWLGQVLRTELGFTGVVLSDALEMEGVLGGRELGAVVGSGLAAGVDLFVCEDLENAMRARDALLALAARDAAAAAGMAAAIGRVRAWRARLVRGVSGEDPMHVLDRVAGPLAAMPRQAIARAGGPHDGLPLDPGRGLLFVVPRELGTSQTLDLDRLGRALAARFPAGRVVALEPRASAGEPELLAGLVAAEPGIQVALGLLGPGAASRWPALAAALGTAGGRVAAALDRPVDVTLLPEGWTRLVTYGFGPPTFEALLDVLCGRLAPVGRCLGLGAAGPGPTDAGRRTVEGG